MQWRFASKDSWGKVVFKYGLDTLSYTSPLLPYFLHSTFSQLWRESKVSLFTEKCIQLYFLAISKIIRNESLHECTNLGRLQCLCLSIPLPTPWPIQDQYSNMKRWSKVFKNQAVISIIFVSKWAFLESKQFFAGGGGGWGGNPFEIH